MFFVVQNSNEPKICNFNISLSLSCVSSELSFKQQLLPDAAAADATIVSSVHVCVSHSQFLVR